MSTTEMRRIFSELNRANLERVPMEHLVARFRAASKGTSVPIKMGSGGELYLRARRWNGPRLERVEKLGAPPADLVEGYQRCNSPGVPMFYAASKRIVALLESRAKVGDVVYLSHWVQNGQLAINGLLLPPMDGDKARNAFDDMFALQLDTLFTRRVHEEFSVDYKLTAAATQLLTTGVELPNGETRAGLMYPSVANKFDGYNTAFYGDLAERCMTLLHVTQLKILAFDEVNQSVRVELVDNANEFPDGVIAWQGNPDAIPTPRFGSDPHMLLLRSDGEKWALPTRNSPPTEEELQQFVAE